MKDFLQEYTSTLARGLWGWLTGFVAEVINIIAASTGLDVPLWAWFAAGGAGLIVAQFQAYRKVREQRERLRRGAANQEALGKISEYRDEIIHLLNEPIKSQVEFDSIKGNYEKLRKQIRDYIQDKISAGESGIFYRIGTFTFLAQSTTQNFEEIKLRSMMAHDAEHLKTLIAEYSRSKKRED